MCKVLRLFLVATLAGVCALGFGVGEAQASCDGSILIGMGSFGSSLGPSCGTQPFLAYWALANGNPAVGFGIDSGSSPGFIDSDRLYVADWVDPGVDGCVLTLLSGSNLPPIGVIVNNGAGEGTSAHGGTLLAFSNDFSDVGQFYVLDFTLSGVASCNPLPVPTICPGCITPGAGGSSNVIASWTDSVVTPDDCATNADSDCFGAGPRNIKTGYQLYSKEAACTLGPITGATGAWTSRGGVVAGTSNTVNVPAASAGNCQFLALSPVFDSGYTAGFLSGTATSGGVIKAIGGSGDADGDGVSDLLDKCPYPSQPANPGNLDGDGDGIGNQCDNCPSVANQDQVDSNGNGTGDACDACPGDPLGDTDGDGVCGGVDNCPLVYNPAPQADSDGDGQGDACDPCPFSASNDSDGDGICGNLDNCPSDYNPSQIDSDGDSKGDACDTCPYEAPVPGCANPYGDCDNDGVCACDVIPCATGEGCQTKFLPGCGSGTFDNCPRVSNPVQEVSGLGDGLGSACEDRFGTAQVRPIHDQGFGDCRVRFRTLNEWNCPTFHVVYRSPFGDRFATSDINCFFCSNGSGQVSSFYGGTGGKYIKFCHGGHDIVIQAVRKYPNSCGLIPPQAVLNVRPEKLATRVR